MKVGFKVYLLSREKEEIGYLVDNWGLCSWIHYLIGSEVISIVAEKKLKMLY